jgi:mRNA-degrading endonuclease toxin of MazEF toxin-antitoxin module
LTKKGGETFMEEKEKDETAEKPTKEQVKAEIKNLFSQLEAILESLKDDDGNFNHEEALAYAEWMLKKAQLRYIDKNKNHSFPILYRRIYWAHMGVNIGSEEDKHRPVVVVRSEKNSPICYVVPLTTQRLNDEYWYHIDLDGFKNTALVEHFRVISKDRIDAPLWRKGDIACITKKDMEEIQKEIRRMFGNEKGNISRITRDNLDEIKKEIERINQELEKK